MKKYTAAICLITSLLFLSSCDVFLNPTSDDNSNTEKTSQKESDKESDKTQTFEYTAENNVPARKTPFDKKLCYEKVNTLELSDGDWTLNDIYISEDVVDSKIILSGTAAQNKITWKSAVTKLDMSAATEASTESQQASSESIDFTERKIVNNYKSSPIKESLLKNKTFNGYFKDKKDNYLSLTELKKILNVCASIKNVIISNIENLSEIFLQYSKIHDKIDYNRMSISSFLQFLKDSNILLVVPDEMKNNFRKLSHKLITRNYNISKVKNFNRTLKYSVSCKNIPMTDKEKDYKKNVSQLVNANAAKENEDKINVSEASIIFSSLTSSYNFPSHKIKIKENFKENIYIGINKDKTFSFDTKREQFKKNIPNKMNFILFIKSFELISERLYPEMTLDDAMANLLNKKILPFIKERKINIINSNEMKEALSKMNDHNIKNFLVKLGNVISPLYSLFADIDGNMKFYQFFDFYKYFDIFPELLSLSQMKAIFFTLCESSSVSLENNNKACTKKTEQIDFILFLESLGISSMFFNFKDIISDIDRLLYICYFIWKSDGIKKQKISQNIPQKINNNFIELFKMYNYNNFNNEDGISLSNKTLNMTERRQGRSYANKNNSNQNSGKKLVLTYNNFDKEYNCSVVNREKYKFEDIYK